MAGTIFAIPAVREIEYTFKNGDDFITLRKWGDEFAHGFETLDGYTVIFDEAKKIWFYAVKGGDGKLYPSNYPVGNLTPESLSIEKQIRFGGDYVGKIRSLWKEKDSITSSDIKAGEAEGTWFLPVLLIDYPDQKFKYNIDLFEDLLFSKNPADPKSMADYFDEVSYGKLNLSGDVTGWYTSQYNKEFYGRNNDYGYDENPDDLVREAVIAADPEVDFSKYDNDNDGYVDTVIVIHSGLCEAWGGTSEDIWSHKSSISTYTTDDGVKVKKYTIQPGQESWGGIVTIGVFCHEFGHILGLPDLYDTDYTSAGIGKFGLMGYGVHNTTNGIIGNSPAHPSAWSRMFLDWANITIIKQAGNYQFLPIEENSLCYKISGVLPSYEYFLVENRQRILFDSALPGMSGGILIWHIDEMIKNNKNEDHKMVDLEQAQPVQSLDISPYDQGTDFDYFRNGKIFTPDTEPDSDSYYEGYQSRISIYNISNVGFDGSMSFSFTTGKIQITPTPTWTMTPPPATKTPTMTITPGMTRTVTPTVSLTPTITPTPTIEDKIPPLVTIESPGEGEEVEAGVYNVVIHAFDESGIKNTSVRFNYGMWFPCENVGSEWTYQWDTSIYPDNTSINIMAMARDNNSNIGFSSVVNVRIKNEYPLKFGLNILGNSTLSPGDVLQVDFFAQTASEPLVVHLYFVLIDPLNRYFSGMDWIGGIHPMLVSYTMPADVNVNDILLLKTTLPSLEPPISVTGNYIFAVAAFKPYTTILQSNIATLSFDFR